jgi:predicted DNA-binding protein YlxM (UPF0122 family)
MAFQENGKTNMPFVPDTPSVGRFVPDAANAGNMYAGEDVVYSPEGIPLNVTAGSAEIKGPAKHAQQIMTGIVSSPITAATGAAKQFAGIPQYLAKLIEEKPQQTLSGLITGQKPTGQLNPIEKGIEALNQIESGAKQAAGPYSWVTNRPSNVAGEIAPYLMGGQAGTLMGETGLTTKFMDAAKNIGQLPSFVKNLASASPKITDLANKIAGATTLGAVTGAGQAEKTGLTLPELTAEKGSNILTNAAISGAIPAAGAVLKPVYENVIKPTAKFGGNVLSHVLTLETGTGAEPFKGAAKAGYAGGQEAQEFARHLREQVPKAEVLNMLQGNLNTMKTAMQNRYRSGMQELSADKTQLDYQPIKDSIRTAVEDFGSYKGKEVNTSVIEAMNKVRAKVKDWQSEPASTFHTPEGFDNLKKSVGEVLEKQEYGTQSYAAVKRVYDNIKDTIAKQAPKYDEVMTDYHKAKELLDEIKNTFSTGKSADTQMRKLQSLMRNNVNTNYGNREDLMQTIINQGGKDIMPALSGQSLSSIAPRGLIGKGADVYALAHLLTSPMTSIPMIAASSPRFMGEAAFAAGKGAKKVTNMLNSAQNPDEAKNLARLLILNKAQEKEQQK